LAAAADGNQTGIAHIRNRSRKNRFEWVRQNVWKSPTSGLFQKRFTCFLKAATDDLVAAP